MMAKKEERPAPPGFAPLTTFKLKRIKRNEEASFEIDDVEKLQKSLKKRPWILNDQLTKLEKQDMKQINKNISVDRILPKGVIRGCPSCNNCQKVIAHWRPDDLCRPQLDYAPVKYPTEEEFKDIFQYIAKIRPEAEKIGICRIVPPASWKPPFLMKGNKWESSKFYTQVQQIDELKELHSRKRLNEPIEESELEYGSDGFGFQRGPEFTIREFKAYAEHYRGNYFHKKSIFAGTPPWENVEGEYWRIIQNPTEEIQVLSGYNLEKKVLGSGFPLPSSCNDDDDDQIAFKKSCWNLNNTAKLPGSLLAFNNDDSTLSTPHMDVGMCLSSLSWKVEEHNLYLLSYMHMGASRIWYGVPAKYQQKCEEMLKKSFSELSGRPELFHKLVTQLSPSILKSEGIPVFRCVQHPKQFVLICPGAYYSAIDSGFSVSEKVNFAPLDWLPHGQLSVDIYSGLCRKTSISYDKILIEGAKDALKERMQEDSDPWKNSCGKDGWFTRALKWCVKRETFKRKFLCNTSQSRKMEENFNPSIKRECTICFYDLYLSAASCQCSPDKYTCLEHSKQLCTCPWSSRIFLFRYELNELNLLVDALERKVQG